MWVRILYRYGIPAGIALFLTWTLTHDVAGNVLAMRAEHAELRFYLRAICINMADTEQKYQNCIAR